MVQCFRNAIHWPLWRRFHGKTALPADRRRRRRPPRGGGDDREAAARCNFLTKPYLRNGDPTGWLGRQDSNLCIKNLCPAGFHCCVAPCREGRTYARLPECGARSAATLAPHDSSRPNRARFLMRRFESCRPASQSVSTASAYARIVSRRGYSPINSRRRNSSSSATHRRGRTGAAGW
jgi:hypothetical protein